MPRILLRLVLILGCIPAQAAEEVGQRLFHPDSLVGWEYGPRPITGWKLTQGHLNGTSEASPLVSGWSFGDVELRFQWQLNKGAWSVRLLDVPQGDGLTLMLEKGRWQLRSGEKVLIEGKIEVGGAHATVLRRAGEMLTVTVDDAPAAGTKIAPDRRFVLGLSLAGEGTLCGLQAIEPPGKPMLATIDDWWCPGDLRAWTIEDGQLTLAKENGNYLRSKKLYGNFTLTLDYRMPKGGNSGVGIRTAREAWPSGDGMELQLMDVPLSQPIDKHAAMAIYGNVPPLARADKPREWNHLVIKADGRMISGWVNGELVQHANTAWQPELKYRNLQGWIGFQDHGARIEVRNFTVLEAPEGLGLKAWSDPPPASAAAALLDRLMNSDTLAHDDGIVSAVVSKTVADGGEQTLAELTGPGAIVRIARANDEGQLSFYFEGEAKPRIKCRAADLVKVLPKVVEDSNPVLTCLAYQKSLKVTLRGAKQGEYRIDSVTFPPALPGVSFAKSDEGFPRGWLAAVDYRREQFGWGVHREHDPLLRRGSTAKNLAPGKSETLVELPGAGVVRWVKLQADKKLLDNNDLWLEATVDGQSDPAVSAPVRFWFPGLVDQGNYPNFVLTDRGGATNFLAMPFGNGIRLALVNRGKRPIKNVGLMVSIAQSERDAQPWRLRAVFETSSGPGKVDLFRRAGEGRWVGLVCQSTSDTPVESLLVDDRPAPGWAGANLDLFFGQKGDFRSAASGRHGTLAWRYLLLDAVEFHSSIAWSAVGRPGDRLAIFYLK